MIASARTQPVAETAYITPTQVSARNWIDVPSWMSVRRPARSISHSAMNENAMLTRLTHTDWLKASLALSPDALKISGR